jgi:adenylyl-sulfate kinase
MPGLGVLLELLDRAHERVSTLCVELRDWSLSPASDELVVTRDDLLGGRLQWLAGAPWPRTSEARRQLWLARPDQLRVEITRGGQLVRLAVRKEQEWWWWDRNEGATTGEIGPASEGRRMPPLLDPPLLTPARLTGSLRLEPSGHGLRAGRPVVFAHARPREKPRSPRELSYEFEFDAEHGTLLRAAAFEDADCVQVTEAIHIAYNVSIDSEQFVFEEPETPAHQAPAGHPDASRASVGQGPTNATRGRTAAARRPVLTVWLTGLPGAGKTTLARELERRLLATRQAVCVLDGDELREGLSGDLRHSREDREEQVRRAAHVAALLSRSGIVAVVALVSPYETDRARARQLHENLGLRFLEVWVDTPLAVCEKRDSKGLYARARAGELVQLTGVDAPYEPPKRPELHLSGDAEDSAVLSERILQLLRASAPAGALDVRAAE